MKPISFTTHIYILKRLNNMRYLEIPKHIVDTIGGIGAKRLLIKVNHTLTYQGGMVALNEGKAYITISSVRMKTLKVKEEDEVHVTLSEDKSKYGTQVPEEITELFKQDPEGKKRFDALTPAMQRYILNYVSTVKSLNLRADRAFLLISNLKKLPKGKETFKEMLGK